MRSTLRMAAVATRGSGDLLETARSCARRMRSASSASTDDGRSMASSSTGRKLAGSCESCPRVRLSSSRVTSRFARTSLHWVCVRLLGHGLLTTAAASAHRCWRWQAFQHCSRSWQAVQEAIRDRAGGRMATDDDDDCKGKESKGLSTLHCFLHAPADAGLATLPCSHQVLATLMHANLFTGKDYTVPRDHQLVICQVSGTCQRLLGSSVLSTRFALCCPASWR